MFYVKVRVGLAEFGRAGLIRTGCNVWLSFEIFVDTIFTPCLVWVFPLTLREAVQKLGLRANTAGKLGSLLSGTILARNFDAVGVTEN